MTLNFKKSTNEPKRFIDKADKLTLKLAEKANKFDLLQTDSLTRLPSVFALNSTIEAFDRKKYDQNTVVICIYIDLKGVKAINDSLGHDKGDEYIKEGGLALSSCFRSGDRADVIYHLSSESANTSPVHHQHFDGDEYIVLFTCSPDVVNEVNIKIRGRLEETKKALQAK